MALGTGNKEANQQCSGLQEFSFTREIDMSPTVVIIRQELL